MTLPSRGLFCQAFWHSSKKRNQYTCLERHEEVKWSEQSHFWLTSQKRHKEEASEGVPLQETDPNHGKQGWWGVGEETYDG